MVWLTFLLHDMASWNIYSKNGVLKYTTKAVEYNEEWMVSESVTFSVTSHEPIYFEVGDYLTYRGLRYSVYSLPSTLKTSRINTYGEGFKWDNIRFYSDIMRLSEIRFLDYVLYDNELHYTSLPNFSFYAETVDDLVDRIQANANHTDSGWIFLTPNLQRTWERYDISMKDEITALWKSYYGEHGEKVDLGRNVNNVNITVSNNNLSEALAMVYNQFGVHYISRDKVVIVGMAGIEAEHVFKYGKGEGLYEIERVADEDQQIVTRLYAYGSDKNLPIRYYAELNKAPYATIDDIIMKSIGQDKSHFMFYMDLAYLSKYFTDEGNWMGGYTIPPSLRLINVTKSSRVKVSIGGYEIIAIAFIDEDDNSGIYASCGLENSLNPASTISNFNEAANSVLDNLMFYFTGYIDISAFPEEHITYTVQDLPDNMAISTLMLPGFPKYSLSQLCKSEYDDLNDITSISYRKTPTSAYNVIMTIPGSHLISFSTDKYRPYIESPNVSTLGIKEGVVEFTEETDENGKQEVYPTIEGMTVGEVFGTSSTERLDEVVSATMITDNGVFGEGEIPNFEIVLKNLGFDLEEAFVNGGSSMVISMKDGYCGGRDFSVKSVHKIAETEQWKLNVERHQDTALSLYFPYSDHVAHGEEPIADEPYQIRTGDHFVLTEIDIADTTYINAASVRALKKAINLLLENDYMRYTYLPKIDEIFMARERDDAEANSRTSLHDWLKGGMLMHFQDTDLDFDNSVFIDHITIKEGTSPIPTYEIVLREKKQVSTMQRILNQISNYGTTGSGGGLSRGQVLSIVSAYADPRFLSKLNADTANGLITFLQGIRLGNYAQGSTGGKFDENGNAEANSLVVRGQTEQRGNLIFGNVPFVPGATGGAVRQIDNDIHAEVDYLSVRKKMDVTEVEIQEVNYVGGNIVLSPADGFTISDVEWDDEDNLFYVYFDALDADTGDMVTPQWQAGDLAFSQKFNIQNSSGGELIHRWWREVEQVVLITQEQDPHYGKCILWLRNDSGHCESIYDGENDYNMPKVGDKVVMLGHIQQSGESETDAEARQGAIILASAGGTTDTNALPYIRVYKDIHEFSLSSAILVKQISYSGEITNAEDMYINLTLGGGGSETKTFQSVYNDISQQTDESFRVWHGETTDVPTLSNEPAIHWHEDESDESDESDSGDSYKDHVGDFYITSDGFCYEFKEVSTGVYNWVIVTDKYLISYVEQIGEKKRVFTSQPVNAKYEIGDLWVNAVWHDSERDWDNVIAVCIHDKGNAFDISDWQLASTEFEEFVEHGLGDAIKEQLDSQVVSFFTDRDRTNDDPSVTEDWPPSEYPDYVGDTWYIYKVVSGGVTRGIDPTYTIGTDVLLVWTATEIEGDTTYGWAIKDDPYTLQTMRLAYTAQDTADGKRRVFIQNSFEQTPSLPYDVGDLWVVTNYPWNNTLPRDAANHIFVNDLLRCRTKKSTGTFDISDWALASDYGIVADRVDASIKVWQTSDSDPEGASMNQFIGYKFQKKGLSTLGTDIWQPLQAAGFKFTPNSAAIQMYYADESDESDESDELPRGYDMAELKFLIEKGKSVAKLLADYIKLEGYTTINDSFGVDLDGNMWAKNGRFGGLVTHEQTIISPDNYLDYGYIDDDGNFVVDIKKCGQYVTFFDSNDSRDYESSDVYMHRFENQQQHAILPDTTKHIFVPLPFVCDYEGDGNGNYDESSYDGVNGFVESRYDGESWVKRYFVANEIIKAREYVGCQVTITNRTFATDVQILGIKGYGQTPYTIPYIGQTQNSQVTLECVSRSADFTQDYPYVGQEEIVWELKEMRPRIIKLESNNASTRYFMGLDDEYKYSEDSNGVPTEYDDVIQDYKDGKYESHVE